MFCVRCGKEGPTVRGLCIDCFLNGRKLIMMPHHVDLERCTSCDDYLVNSRWVTMSLQEAVEQAAVGVITHIPEAKVKEVSARAEPTDPRNFEGEVEVTLDIDGHEETVRDRTIVRVKNTVCQRCSRQLGNYYESILQVRSPEKELEKSLQAEVLESVLDKVDRQSRSNRQIFISKVEEMHGGLDFYLSSISLGKGLSRDLVNEYGAELKESSTLVGRKDDGSDMYRVTYLVRMPVYKQGDVVLQNDVPHHIVSLSKNAVKLLNLRDFRIQTVKPADMRALKVVRKREEIQDAVVVNAGEGEAQVLHPGNFRTVDIRLPTGFQAGETVRVVEHEGEILLIP